MKTAVGNHVGLVVNTNDPENRGRVQVYVPHISTTLYNNWNEKLENIEFKTFEESIFDSEIKERLLSLLPWAEAAVPIWGGGTGAPVNTDTGEATPFPTEQSFSYQGATADYKKLFAPNKSDFGLSENMKTALGGFAANFPNAIITSAKRDYVPEGGSQTSLHLSGNAIDVAMPASPVEQERIVNWWMTQGGATEIGWEGNHIHVGFRQDGNKSVFWRNSPSESIKTNLAGSPSWFQNIGNQYKNGTLQRYAQAPKTNEPVSGKVDPREIEIDGLARSDGVYTGETIINSSEIGDTKSMSPAFKTQYERVLNYLNGSKFDPASNGGKYIIPDDGKTYGITTGSKEEWAHLFTRLASVESSITPNIEADIYGNQPGQPKYNGTSTSFGIYQLGNERIKLGENKFDPNDNTRAFIRTAEDLYFGKTYGKPGNGVIGGTGNNASGPRGNYYGLAAAFGPIAAITNGTENKHQRQLLAENMLASQKSNGNYTGGSNGNKIFRTTNQVLMATGSYNAGRIGGPAGMFSCPAVGAKVWVFFQAENPQRPVYFANVYEPSNAYAAGVPS